MTHPVLPSEAGSTSEGDRTILDVLRRRSAEQPAETVFTLLQAARADAETLTFGDLDRRARAIASRLTDEGLRGERVLLLYPAGLGFVEAFFGCLYAGVIAVPAFPPRSGRTLSRLGTIAADAGARAALSPLGMLARSRGAASAHPALAALRWIATDEPQAAPSTGFRPAAPDPDSVAYLQYTSGSTTEPKGVMISHANIVANSEEIRRGFGHTRESRSLCWLPHFHDMGLVDGIIQPVYSGFSALLMDPTGFLQSPARWLEAISEHAITHSGAPNFAYDLCARRVEPDPGKLDLRSWAVAYNGAEPVRAATLDAFASRFAPCGFRREAFYPAYGLAEATLKVSGGTRGDGPSVLRVNRTTLEAGRAEDDGAGPALVGAGRPGGGTLIEIVDAETGRRLPPDTVGEVWVSGPGVARGYWNRQEETEATFGARLPGGTTRFLRTGDLGFVRDGELFVTGRAKDLIIIRGRNVYPQDVERTAESCGAALRTGGGAAFGVEAAGEERLVVVHEVERHGGSDRSGHSGHDTLLAAIREAIVETLEIDPHAILLVRTGGVPRTTSGKVRRAACRKAFLEGSLPVVTEWRAPEPSTAPGTAVTSGLGGKGDARTWLVSRVAAKLGIAHDSIALDQPLARFGLDSLRSIELGLEIEEAFGIRVQATELLAASSLSAIISRIEAAEPRPPAHAPGLTDDAQVEECPLSAGQQALWFLHELAPESAAYTIASALRLVGPLDEEALERALRALVERHASLRARIVVGRGGPLQRFDVSFDAIYSRGDLRGTPPGEIAARLADEAHRPFDLTAGPLFRVSLLSEEGARVLLISAHHAVADLWSLSVVLRDLQSLYAAESGAGPSSAASTAQASHPAAFVRWQADLVGGEAGERQLAFWLDQLSGDLPALDLPVDRPRPPVQSFAGGARSRRLDPALAGALRDLARSRGITLSTLLLTAYQVYLGRMAGQREVMVGMPATGRTRSEFSGLVAYLVNSVVVRADLGEDPSFDELARTTRDDVLAALANQDYPFATLVKRLAPQRDPSRSPLFDAMFDFHAAGDLVRGDLAAPGGAASARFAGGVEAEPIAIERRAAQFDLSLTVTDSGGEITLELEYNADLFDAARIDGIGRGFETLLGGVAADPSARVSRLPLLTPAEREEALEASRARAQASEVIRFEPIHRIFEREASRHPDAVAAVHGNHRLTYGDLNRRANAVARRLRDAGVRAETRVAVCLEKSLDLLVAFMAILKAGGAYVPVDPALPSARRRFLAADSGAHLVLCRGGAPGDAGTALEFGPDVPCLPEAEWALLTGERKEGENLDIRPAPLGLAYIIYTSGTTGTPKGVAATHANLFSAYQAWEEGYATRTLASHLQMASPSFDVFTGDLVRALLSGGSLVLCDRDTLLDPPALEALAREHRVDYAEFVPATLRGLSAHLARAGRRLDHVRLVVVGSDAWSMADYALFRQVFGPATRILNSYGVTEATVDSTFDEVRDEPVKRPAPPIGRPLSNTAAYVLDGNLEPVPDLVRAELYLGGPAVTRGYAGRPDLTADRFVPDPFGPPGSRMYRTGDVARRLPGGRIEFIGRHDGQVKVRGFRIEPTEIEAALEEHPDVRACVVVARDHGVDRRLVAYVVLGQDRADAAGLRGHLAGRLPEYMVPSAIVLLDALPLSANGKIDRRSLPEPDWGASEAAGGDGAAEPATDAERALAEIWKGALGIARVGANDNFFELGGDSILSIQIVARAREAGIQISPRMLFEHPTIGDLARAAEALPAGAPESPAWEGEAALLPIQHWFFAQRLEDPSHWNMAIALDSKEPLDTAAARRAASALLDHHDALRARFTRHASGWRQVIEPRGSREADLQIVEVTRGWTHDDAVGWCAGLLHEGLDLENGPLIRFGVVLDGIASGARAKTTLVLVAHHLVVDGVSLRLLVEDFERGYRRALRGEPIELPARSTPAAAWAAALTEAVRARRFEADLEHWKQLARADVSVPALTSLGTLGALGPDPAERTSAALTIELDEKRTRELLDAAAAAGARVDHLLLAALASALAGPQGPILEARHAGNARKGSLYIEIEGHGRDGVSDLDTSRTVGWFTETHPILIEEVDPLDMPATLQAVARATRRGSGVGFNALRYLSPDPLVRDALGRVPAPRVSFNYLGGFDASLGSASLFENLREPSSTRRSPRARRTHALEIDASVVGGKLGVRWSYSRAQCEGPAISRLAASFEEALQVFVAGGAQAETTFPLTPMQEGMLFHHLQDADADPYVGQIALELTGDVRPEMLARAWQAAVEAHPALRTEFVWEGVDLPVQVVRREVALPIAVHGPGEAALEDVMARARSAGFDVSRAPLARVDIVVSDGDIVRDATMDDRRTTVVFTHHHLLIDGWSLPLVLQTVFETYECLAAGRPVPRREAISLNAYFEWAAGRDLGDAERFFRHHLEGFASATPAPDAGGRPARAGAATERSGVVRTRAAADVERRARALGLTPNTLVQAAWALVLAHSAGERDVVFGATSSGRPPGVEGMESAVGLFINTLPMRVRVDPRASARAWMLEIQRLGAELRQYEYAPLASVQRWGATAPNTPLFETLLVFENYPIDVAALGRRETFAVTGVHLHEETNYPLTIVSMSVDGLGFRALYDRSRYDEPEVRLILDRLTTTMENLLSRPEAMVGAIEVLAPAERRRLVETWNDTRRDYRRDATIVEMFEEIAREHRNDVALVFDGGSTTYGELHERALACARSLRCHGVGLESRVALAMDRSPGLIEAMLGVLLAGGAYVPVDPESPPARTARTLAAAQVSLVVTDGARPLPDGPFEVVSHEELRSTAAASTAPLPDVLPENLAYVIFTSGSTGEPKGTEVPHRNVLRLVLGADYVRFGPDQTTLLLSSIAFDVSTFEIWGALLHGGRVAIPPRGAASPAEIAGLIQRLGVTTLWLTSGLFPVVVDEELAALARVPQVLSGGDVVSPPHVRRLLAAGCRRVVNGYGPTETTTFACCGGLSPGDEVGERVPIGRPIANTRVYVLAEGMRLAPIGAPGELFIGGDGVARGYARRPDLTAARFVPDPFGPPGSRLYATGDIVRWRRDGRLEFIGRRDRQVKVRGFRVEVDDVETALAACPGVRAAAVVARCEAGVTELIGYVVPEVAGTRDTTALRSAIAERVPRYMVPTRLVLLDALPLMPNGKVDRRALPEPGREERAPRAVRVMTPVEEAVAEIWRYVLGVAQVGPEDDFFEIGGHSLHATRVVARLRRAFGVDVPLRAIFEAPTLRELAARMEAARRAPAPPIERAPDEERRKASYAQSRLWFLDRLEPGSAAYNIASAIRLDGALDVTALGQALSEIVRRHEALRTRFTEGALVDGRVGQEEGPLQIIDPPEPLAIPLEDLSSLSPAEREREIASRVGATAREPFDLARGPVLRARLMRLGAEDHVLTLAVHHIAADGWSIGVLVEELAAAYAAFSRGEEPRLPELRVQYADWAAWQRAWLEGGEMERQLAYWHAELQDVEPLNLPTDRPRPARPTYAGASLAVTLREEVVLRLERLARSEGATLHMALLAGFAAVLGRWSGQSDFGIGTPVANRTREEAEPLIGFFVNTLVVRARLGGRRLSYRELLGRVREAALGGHANQDVPFERIVEALQPERDLSRTPLFQVMLVLQNAPVGKLDLGNVRLRPFEAPTGTSTFDLTLSLETDAAGSGALAGSVEYSTELFEEATVRRLWDHVVRLLETVAENPEADVHTSSLIGLEERSRALDAWSGRLELAAGGPLVHERFAEVAAARPGLVAGVLGERRVTYGEIHARAHRMAGLLAGLGIGAESRVGLCVDRSPEMLVGMIGTLEAGAAFVPLDPDHPRDRLAFALADSGARVVLATRASASRVEGSGRTILLLDDGTEIAGSPADPLDASAPGERSRPTADSLAYVIYTSGTTGRPKGVMVTHGALAAAYRAWERLYGLGEIRIHLQMAGIAFDVCTGDVVRALCSGGTLVFCDRERLLDPARLFELASREKAEFAEFVPAVLRHLAAHARDRGERLDTIRVAAVGSDVWTTAEIDQFRAVFGPRARLANSYGVTEATIDSTCCFVGEGDAGDGGGGRDGGGGSPPIGRPLAHTTVYVLDDNLEPTSPGVIGELYLGGPAVARGYIGRPDQTAERFLPDPFGEPGARLYRTGDRARYLADGGVAFAGRADDQVKIRGQRIEPAEVEAAITALGSIAACAVAPRRDGEGVARLAAYVVPRDGGRFDPEEARRLLRERLPEAMVPSAIVVLESLPLTPNGKVDRRKLPEPDWGSLHEYEPPRTATETAVAAAFTDVLGLAQVGAGDDFFALGGHSLVATRVVSRLRASLGIEVPLRTLFESPSVRSFAARIDDLRVTRVPAGVPAMAATTLIPPVGRASEAQRRRLSYSQQRLWFLDRLEPGSPAYNLPSSLLLEGDLDVAALERALAGVLLRHEALRTVYPEMDGGPEQVVLPPEPIEMEVEDLSFLSESDRRVEQDRLSRLEAQRPFDLARGPLLRAKLLRLAQRRHALLVTVHHIAADGWSLVVLVRELGALYGAVLRGEASPLPELAIQYADWAAWQRAWLEGGEMERQLAYWGAELDGSETLVLPSDRPRPSRRAYSGASMDVRFDAHLRQRLERLARAEGATLHMALLAAYGAVLGRWSGQTDFAVGTPIANRRTTEVEPIIGFCVNTLAMRVRLGRSERDGRSERHGRSGLTFRNLLGRVREAALGAHANQDVPFERVVEEIHPERYLGHNPLFQALFALQNVPVGELELPGLSFSYEEPETGICRFDVELFLAEVDAGLEGLINYSTELFDRVTMERFIENLTSLLEAAVENPDRPLADLSALAAPQRRLALLEWNAAREIYPEPPVVHEMFERQAALHPEYPAARFGDLQLGYGELNRRANQLARFLRRQGIGAEDLVAVCVERSFDMLTALLATLKAGAAYVPIDPEYPRDRLALLLEDAGARAVLTQSHLAGRLPGRPGEWSPPAICLDQDGDEIAREEAGDLGIDVHPDALVYVVYTSGSTGKPKGVAMTHRAISNLLSWQRRDSGAERGPRTLQFASLSFDVSFQEIFSTLTAGGEIVLVDEEERRDAARLLRLIAADRIERLFMPFVALNQLAEAARTEEIHPPCLREIDTAGEQLKITPAIAAFFSRLPMCRLVNHYGPSETHLVTTFELAGTPEQWPELPPIGRPIANAPVYLLDDGGRPVPIGATGEVYVGGAGLARGYHARPDLTAGLFVPDPFSGTLSAPGARLYRTGDLARFRSDGELEFLGRRDLQVKVRGYRVEPGEIEVALARHPAVRQAVVAAHDHPGGKRLAAYVVLHEAARVMPGELREHLARSLPDFMVPAAIVPLDALPATPSGKVDRKALRQPDWDALTGRVAPRTAEEEIVCGIFADVLEVESVGAEDNFFDLGGHSLLATQVISRIRRAFGAEVPLRALFEAPTPAGIALSAVEARALSGITATAPPPPPIRKAAPEARRKLSYAQRRLWFLDRLEPGSAVYVLPAAVRLEGDLDIEALEQALGEIVRRHEALRTRFVDGPLGPEQVIDAPERFRLDPEVVPQAEARRLLADDAARPFDLSRGPVLRARLLRLGPREHLLSLIAHHIAADGWSMGILLRELGLLYGAFAAGTDSPLPDLPIQYADWAVWQREWLEGGELDRQLAYWREALASAPRALELATDRARPATATFNGATLEVRLSADLRARLQRLARSEGATLHMALLAGYAWTLMRHSGQRDVVVGTPVANRRAAEAEALVGFFVNTLAVRVQGDGSSLSFRQLLARVRESSLGAYANQDVPFERVVEEIQPERALNRAPIFQTALALQNARMPWIDMQGLRMTPFEIDASTAKFDLMLILEEDAEGLSGAFEYNTDLFDRETIERISASLETLLGWAVRAPDSPIAAAPLLGEEEKRRILTDWSAATATMPADGTLLHELVETRAWMTPDAPALTDGAESINYGQLESGANRLADYLRSLGVGPETRVGILLERSPAAIVSLLAVLKAGGAYVPMDPGEPAERTRHVVNDSRAAVVITESRLAAAVSATGSGSGARIVALDTDAGLIAARPAGRVIGGARPGNLAYVIYTSGSTGRPKGVGVEHRQIAGYVAAAVERLGIQPGWSFALVSTLAADLGNTVIFPALTTGGCLHVLPPELAFDASGVEAYFARHAIDCLKIVPSHLQALHGGPHPALTMPRKLLVLGGEATPGPRLATLRSLQPGCRVANHYGPTEATVGAAAGFPEASDAARQTAPLGRPLANSRAYVLDPQGCPLPAGTPGELYLAGGGVTRGYLDRPGLTAERFLPDPFSGRTGDRMYRTGDRARWLRDGRLEFLGRDDGQVKVRGFRVELGEIESAIEAHPGVARAAVVAREDAPGDARGVRLTAYVVPEARVSPTVQGLARRRLRSGVAVAELNRHETDYLEREIFELGAYVRHGITLRDGDTVLDVGANIGLFTIFASLACTSPRLLLLEPNPHLMPILRANAAVYAPDAVLLDVGLAEREREAAFTFFPGFSLLSGLHADAATEKQIVKAFLENQARAGVDGAEAFSREADALLDGRFAGLTIEVKLRTLSNVIAENRVDRIGLLKVNVEKAELDVLRGIREEDWARIDQAVVEVDVAAHLEPIVSLFEAHDFEVLADQDPLLERTDLHYVYAARRGSGRALVAGAPPSVRPSPPSEPFLTVEALRERLARELPGSMQPAAWVVLETLPLTVNGKLDRARLPEAAPRDDLYVAPRGELERAIAGIWARALQVPRVGAHDNFFDIGGHSLLLARIHSQLRESLGADLSVVDLFRFPTVASLAARLASHDQGRADETVSRAHHERGARRREATGARARTRRGPNARAVE